jgi:two-component system, OmpR family, sensor kinase
MSLRGRLLGGLLGLCVVGLLAAGVGTYVALHSFLYSRVDQQLLAARRSAGESLGAGQRSPPTIDPSLLRGIAPDTFVEVRNRANHVVALSRAGFRGALAPAPKLPAVLHPPATAKSGVPFVTAALRFDSGAVSGSGSYRVLVSSLGPSGLTLVLAVPLADVSATLGRLVLVEAVIAGAVLVLLGFGAFWLLRAGLRPLERIAQTAGGIAHGDLDVRVSPADERSEVGRLGLALNGMLERLEEAFSRRDQSEAQLRRFVSSASHELRTPLTSIRGYAALFRRGAADNPGDLATSMARIESEATRMGVLIDDLLLLARLDEQRPLDREPVDLTQLALDAVQDAQVRDPQRSITVDHHGPVNVLGDEPRLRQVAANLLENAQVHTPARTPVRVGVEVRDGQAVLSVTDAGPGIDPQHAPHIFERFYRGTPVGSQDAAPRTAGTGLGLAVVAAIAESHRGSVSVRSESGHGARFEITLPLAEAASAPGAGEASHAGPVASAAVPRTHS